MADPDVTSVSAAGRQFAADGGCVKDVIFGELALLGDVLPVLEVLREVACDDWLEKVVAG